jgi:HEAT repeat protein
MLKDPQIAIRMRAMQTLMGFGPMASEAIPELIRLTKDFPTWETRHTAVQALGIIGWEKDGPTTKVTDALYKALQDKSAQVRLSAIASIERLGVPDNKNHKIAFEAAMEPVARGDLDPIVRINANLSLYEPLQKGKKRVRSQKDRRVIIAKYLEHPETAVRAEAAKALGMLGDEACDQAKALAAGIGDKDAAVSLACILALGQMKKCEEARTPLGKVLGGKGDAFKRAEAAKAIGGMGEDASDQLATVIAGLADKDANVSAACIMALGGMAKLRGARQALAPLLEDKEAFKRGEAAKGLGNAGPEAIDYLPALVKTMEDKDPAVAGWAIWAVGAIGEAAQRVLPQLRAIANDETKPAVLRQAAKDAIDHITGKDKKKETKKKGAGE